MKKCAILSMDCLDDFEVYDQLIEPYLEQQGWQVDTLSWRKTGVDWDQYDVVVVRTPWDYQDDPEAFMQVLEEIDSSSAHLENSLDIVRWNIDKIYLKELERQGVALVPTKWHDRLAKRALTQDELATFFALVGNEQIVLKPRISANADNTFWLKSDSATQPLEALNSALAQRDFMIQPFVPAVIEEGEYSLFYFNGEYSHAILKTPKQDDFRVQEEHGGRLQTVEPEQELLNCATKCMTAIKDIHQMPLYARLDLVRFDDTFVLMEAELIEPSLYFNMDDESPKRFVEALLAKLK